MKILGRKLKEGEVTVQVTNNEDLWYLSHVVEESDHIRGQTERKIKIGSDENAKVVRKPVYMKIRTEKTEYVPETNSLRLLGTILEGPEDVPLGSHHSFNLNLHDVITITKHRWPKYLLDKLEEATKEKTKILLVVFDREEAYFAQLKSQGYEKLSELKGDVSKKAEETTKKDNFYAEIVNGIKEYDSRLNIERIVIASPAFWKEYLLKELPDNLRKKTMTATVSEASWSAFEELLKREELKKALEDDRVTNELKAIEEILLAIKREKACYGLADSKEKISMGAVSLLAVSENLLREMKDKGNYGEIDRLIKSAEDMNAEIRIISGKEPSKRLDALGGIAGTLRWQA